MRCRASERALTDVSNNHDFAAVISLEMSAVTRSTAQRNVPEDQYSAQSL